MLTLRVKRIHDVRISPAMNDGFTIQVGCFNFVCGGSKKAIDEMCAEIAEYLKEPQIYEATLRKQQRAIDRIAQEHHATIAGNEVASYPDCDCERTYAAEPCEVAPPTPLGRL